MICNRLASVAWAVERLGTALRPALALVITVTFPILPCHGGSSAARIGFGNPADTSRNVPVSLNSEVAQQKWPYVIYVLFTWITFLYSWLETWNQIINKIQEYMLIMFSSFCSLILLDSFQSQDGYRLSARVRAQDPSWELMWYVQLEERP